MKNELEMVLFSRRPLTESFAKQQITALSDFGDGLMRPDKCNHIEPLRHPFDPTDINKPVQWLSEPHGNFFYKKGRPAHASGQMWNRSHSLTARFPSPLFLNYWTGQFDGKWAAGVGIERVEEFVAEMFRMTCSDFALMTTEVDRNVKNRNAESLSYKGFDLDSAIPGLYWINFFSNGFARWLGINEFPKELASSKTLPCGGISLKFCDSLDLCRNLDVLQKQRATIEWLGTEKFFDIRFPDRKLNALDWNKIPMPGGLS